MTGRVASRAIVLAMAVTLACAAFVAIAGGFRVSVFGLRVSIASALRPTVVFVVLLAVYAFKYGWQSLLDEMRALSAGGLAPIAVVFSAIIASYGDYIPYWDAKSYFDCIARAAGQRFSPFNFTCVGHPSAVYLSLLGIGQYLTPWKLGFAYAVNAVLGIVSIVAFDRVLRALFPKLSTPEYTLGTALYAFTPLFLVHAIFINVDYGMTAFFVMFLAALLNRRYWLACIAAVATMLSKEVGAAAFLLVVAADTIAFVLRTDESSGGRLAALRARSPLVAAPLAIVIYVAAYQSARSGSWAGAYLPAGVIGDRLDFFLNTNLADPHIRSYLADVFVLNFQWIFTAAIVLAFGVRALRVSAKPHGRIQPGTGTFLTLVAAGLIYAVTRYRAYNNARYVLIVAPILVLSFHAALQTLFASSRLRSAVLSISVVLVFVSNFRTIDGVSKRLFGTFEFGTHQLLDMPSLVRGAKLDAIVYNLESLQFHYLFADAIKELQPGPRSMLFMAETVYNFPPAIDAQSYAPTLDPSHALPLDILWRDTDVQPAVLREHVAGDGAPIVYLAFANADNHQLRMLQDLYPVVGVKRYDRSGYWLDVYTLSFRPRR